MIKYNDEKRNSIFDNINLIIDDIKVFGKTTKNEIKFIKEILNNFENINLAYLNNLDNLIKLVEKRKKDEILNDKARHFNIKKTYSSILNFTFEKFYDIFKIFKENFIKNSSEYKENFLENINLYEENFLDLLLKKNKEFQSQINCYKIEEEEYLKIRKKFLDFVDKQKLSKTQYYINFSNLKTREIKSLEKKEFEYFKKYIYQNKLLNLIVVNLTTLLENYEQIIRSKFSLIYFKLINPKEPKTAKIEKFENLISDYKLKFRNLRITTYLTNLNQLKEKYFPLKKIVLYKSKLTLKSMQEIIKEIKEIKKQINSANIYSKIDFFIHILIFDMKVIKKIKIVESDLLNLCKLEHIKILFLNLYLFLEYEDSFLFISTNSFDIIKNLILIFLNNLNIEESEGFIDLIDLLFKIGTKIYNVNINQSQYVDISLIEYSLLASFKDTFLAKDENLWKNFYNFSLSKLKRDKICTKSKIIHIVEQIFFYHYYLSQNERVTEEFVEKILSENNNLNSVNLTSIKKCVILKLSTYLYRFHKEIENKGPKQKNIPKARNLQIFKILVKKKSEYLDKEVLRKVLGLSREIRRNVKIILIKKKLFTIGEKNEDRQKLWLSYINYFPYKTWERSDLAVTQLDDQMIKQIKMDVKRTKKNSNENYKIKLEEIIVEFFTHCSEPLEYFQGFNYIVSFLLDVFKEKQICLSILDFISKFVLRDFFSSKFALRVNQINFQINNLIEDYYPDLSVHWRNYEIEAEVLFSSLIVSLFSSFFDDDKHEYICLFWDIILAEKWMGVIKSILFIIDLFYDKFITLNSEQTLCFFFDLKTKDILKKKIKDYDFKKFINNFHFDKKKFVELEIKFNSITDNINKFNIS